MTTEFYVSRVHTVADQERLDDSMKSLVPEGSRFSYLVLGEYYAECSKKGLVRSEPGDWSRSHFTEHGEERVIAMANVVQRLYFNKVEAQADRIRVLQTALSDTRSEVDRMRDAAQRERVTRDLEMVTLRNTIAELYASARSRSAFVPSSAPLTRHVVVGSGHHG